MAQIFINNVQRDVSRAELEAEVGAFGGTVVPGFPRKDKFNKGALFAIADIPDDQVTAAVTALHGKNLRGNNLKVKPKGATAASSTPVSGPVTTTSSATDGDGPLDKILGGTALAFLIPALTSFTAGRVEEGIRSVQDAIAKHRNIADLKTPPTPPPVAAPPSKTPRIEARSSATPNSGGEYKITVWGLDAKDHEVAHKFTVATSHPMLVEEIGGQNRSEHLTDTLEFETIPGEKLVLMVRLEGEPEDLISAWVEIVPVNSGVQAPRRLILPIIPT
jgi:hypothetical protein